MIANDVFSLAARQASWLLAKQRLVAQNVANANTPGYKTADLKPFDATLKSAALQLDTTSPPHFSLDASQTGAISNAQEPEIDEIYYSGNDVSHEEEQSKAGAILRAYSLNTSVVKAFNNMIQQASKG